MKKRVVSWLLVVLMLTSMLPTGVWAEDVYRSSEDTGRYGVSTLASAADAELKGFFNEWEGIATVANAATLGFVRDGDKLKSGNSTASYTRSTLTVTMLKAAELSFDYRLSGPSQSGMEVKNGSKTLYTYSSYGSSGAEIVKGTDSGTATVQANAGDVITISYYRGYASSGSNCMWLSNFQAKLPAQVIFHANDGTETTVQQGVFGSGTLQANTFKRDGYRFEGWATTPDGAVAYADKGSITITENTDLYAVWTRVYRVAFQLTPADAQFSLYGDEARTALIAADSGTAYTLAAGTYYYSVSAFGYAAVQGSVTVSGDAQEPVALAEKPVVTVTFAYADGKTDVDGGKLTVRTGERDMAAEEGSDGMSFRLPAGYAYDWSFRSANYGKQSGTVDLTGVSESGTRSVTIPMTAKSAWEGAGDISEPAAVDGVYQITSGSELAWLAQQVNAGVSDGTGFSAVLCNDIDLGDEAWTPIGNGTGKAYKGTFDGQGYTIRNLYVTGSTPMDYGLFGTVNGGTVRNVTVEGRVEVTSNSSRYGIAAIVGQLYGTTGGVENCLNRASVKGGQYVGGIVGYVAGGYSSDEKFIKNCGNVGDVTSEGHRAAGIAANISGQVAVENCYSTGTITGGGWYSGGISAYVDSSYASVKNCYAAGSVTGSGAGAVFGKVSYSSTVVANCYYPDTLSVGDSKAVKVTEQQLKTLDSAAALGEAFMQDAKSINGGYPILTWQITTYEVTFTVTPEDAEVRIDGAKGKQNGNVWTFRLPEGTYSYTAFAFGYADESGNIEVSGAARKDITLTPVEKRTVRFSVTPKDAGAAVTVQWNGKTVAAEQDGSYRLPDGTYTYTVRAKGYAKVSQTLKVSGDVTVPVTLEPSAAWDGQTVTAPEAGAGLDKAEYLLSGTAFTKEADAGAADGWTALTLDTDGRGSFTVAPNSKGFLYVKAIDREGNVTVVNADGMVVYTDAEQITERVSFAEASADDCVFRVKDNGSTVRSITMGSRALVRDTEYRIGASANGQLAITLTNSFLTALTAGSYTLTVSYDPLGETYVSGGDNQAPASTTVVLTVGRSTVDADIASMDKIYDSEPVTPSANTESDGVMTWEFKPDGADPGAYTTAAPEDAGTYNVRLTVAETEHYDRIEKTGTFTITPKEIRLHTPALEDKTYDGSTSIVCRYYYPERAMEGKISGDDLSVVMGQANADSPDVGRRTVTFTGFALAGSDAANYTLAAQPISGSAAITARPLSIGSLTVRDKLYDGLNTAAIEGTPTLVNLADGETLMLRCGMPTFDTVAAGDNIPVSFTEFTIADSANGKAGNYSLTQPAGITASIRAYTATGAEYTASTGQWTNQDFMVTAADGWQVSGTNTANGDWRGSLTRSDETGTGNLTFYVKNTADGYISESVTLTYKIDKTNPTGEIRIDQRNAWQSFWNTISFDLFYKSRQTVTLTAADEASGVTAIEYLLSEEDYTAAQLDGMTLQPYTAPVAITPDDRLIAYARITDAAGNVTYLRSDGVVLDAAAPVIAGVDDGAVYCGSVTFTVTDAYLDTVTVDGTAAVSVPSRAAGSTYIIEADSQPHTIVATDRAGNSTQVQITVNDGHTVGTPATCKAPAVCRYCGESFGDPAPGNHGGLLRRVAKVNATSTADGNIEYWYCSGCGKYYLDATAVREITRRDTILPAIGLRIVDDVRVWRPGDKPLGVTFRQEYDDFTAQIDGVTVDPANYEVTADPDGGRLIVTFRAQFLRTLAFGERTITIASDDGSASVSFRRDSARAVTSGGKDGGKAGVTSAATGDGFPMGGMAAALLVSGSALVMLTTRARRKEEE